MKVTEAIGNVRRLFLDTAPLIYHVQGHPKYFACTRFIFELVDAGTIQAVTSTITLAESLVLPLRKNDQDLSDRFRDRILFGMNTVHAGVDTVAESAAALRARYNLTLLDAFQVACAHDLGCDAFLTNDKGLSRIDGIGILLLDELQAP